MRQFHWTTPDGTDREGSAVKALAAAGRRIVKGEGPFLVVRAVDGADGYRHPDLPRHRALHLLGGMLRERMDVGERALVYDKAGTLQFACHRIKYVPYDDPFRDVAGLIPYRQDMGVDYAARQDSPVYAIGPGVVTRVDPYPSGNGWPWTAARPDDGAIVCYRITEGPAKGLHVYLAEHITIRVKDGEKVDKDTVIATLHPGFANCEIGWADDQGYSAEARTYYREGERTAHGDNFNKLLVALGTPSGLEQGRPVVGDLPNKYPRKWRGKV